MGQSTSKRRSFTPGVNKNAEVATPALVNGDGVNRNVGTGNNRDFSAVDEEEADTSTLPTASASSSTHTGKTEKRKRFRVPFPIRRTPSGRWSRKKRATSQNGTRLAVGSSIIGEGQHTIAGKSQSLPVEEHEKQGDSNPTVMVDHAGGEKSASESKGRSRPASKPSEKMGGKRGSQKNSGRKKRKEKGNLKKDTKKKNKESSAELMNVAASDDVLGGVPTLQEMKEKNKEELDKVVVEMVASGTLHSQQGAGVELDAADSVNSSQQHVTAELYSIHAIPEEHVNDPFAPISTHHKSKDDVQPRFETEREIIKKKKPKIIGTPHTIPDNNTENAIDNIPEHFSEHLESLDMQEELLQFFVSEKETSAAPSCDASISAEGNYEWIFNPPKFTSNEQTAEAGSVMKDAQIEPKEIKSFTASTSDGHDARNNTSYKPHSQDHGANNDTFWSSCPRGGSTNNGTFKMPLSEGHVINNDTSEVSHAQGHSLIIDTSEVSNSRGHSPKNDTSEVSKSRGHSSNNDTSKESFSSYLGINYGVGFFGNSFKTQELSKEQDTSNHMIDEALLEENSKQTPSDYCLPFRAEVTEEVNATISQKNSSVIKKAKYECMDATKIQESMLHDEVLYGNMGVQMSQETESESVAKENVGQDSKAAIEIVDDSEGYEAAEVKVLLAKQQVKDDFDKSNSQVDNNNLFGIKHMSNNMENASEDDIEGQIKNLEVDLIENQKKEREDNDIRRISTEERRNKEWNEVEKIEKYKSEELMLTKIPNELSNLFDNNDNQTNSSGRVEMKTEATDGESSATDLCIHKHHLALVVEEQAKKIKIYPMEQTAAEFMSASPKFPDKANITPDNSISSEAESSPFLWEARSPTSLSPTSPTSYSGKMPSTSFEGEKGDRSSFLKKISLGPRLRTAILRKKSSVDLGSGQEAKRISLTRPKTVELTDIQPPTRWINPREPEEQLTPITKLDHVKAFSIDNNPQLPVKINDSAEDSTIQPKTLDSIYTTTTASGTTQLFFSEGGTTDTLFPYNSSCPEEGIREDASTNVSCGPAAELLTSSVKKKLENTSGVMEELEKIVGVHEEKMPGDNVEIENVSAGKNEFKNIADNKEELKSTSAVKEELKNTSDAKEELKSTSDAKEELKNTSRPKEELKNTSDAKEELENTSKANRDFENYPGAKEKLEHITGAKEKLEVSMTDFMSHNNKDDMYLPLGNITNPFSRPEEEIDNERAYLTGSEVGIDCDRISLFDSDSDQIALSRPEGVIESEKTASFESEVVMGHEKTALNESEVVTGNEKIASFGSEVLTGHEKTALNESEVVTAHEKTALNESEVVTAHEKTASNESEVVTAHEKTASNESEVLTAHEKTALFGSEVLTAHEKTVLNESEVLTAHEKTVLNESEVEVCHEKTALFAHKAEPDNKPVSVEINVETDEHKTDCTEQEVIMNINCTPGVELSRYISTELTMPSLIYSPSEIPSLVTRHTSENQTDHYVGTDDRVGIVENEVTADVDIVPVLTIPLSTESVAELSSQLSLTQTPINHDMTVDRDYPQFDGTAYLDKKYKHASENHQNLMGNTTGQVSTLQESLHPAENNSSKQESRHQDQCPKGIHPAENPSSKQESRHQDQCPQSIHPAEDSSSKQDFRHHEQCPESIYPAEDPSSKQESRHQDQCLQGIHPAEDPSSKQESRHQDQCPQGIHPTENSSSKQEFRHHEQCPESIYPAENPSSKQESRHQDQCPKGIHPTENPSSKQESRHQDQYPQSIHPAENPSSKQKSRHQDQCPQGIHPVGDPSSKQESRHQDQCPKGIHPAEDSSSKQDFRHHEQCPERIYPAEDPSSKQESRHQDQCPQSIHPAEDPSSKQESRHQDQCPQSIHPAEDPSSKQDFRHHEQCPERIYPAEDPSSKQESRHQDQCPQSIHPAEDPSSKQESRHQDQCPKGIHPTENSSSKQDFRHHEQCPQSIHPAEDSSSKQDFRHHEQCPESIYPVEDPSSKQESRNQDQCPQSIHPAEDPSSKQDFRNQDQCPQGIHPAEDPSSKQDFRNQDQCPQSIHPAEDPSSKQDSRNQDQCPQGIHPAEDPSSKQDSRNQDQCPQGIHPAEDPSSKQDSRNQDQCPQGIHPAEDPSSKQDSRNQDQCPEDSQTKLCSQTHQNISVRTIAEYYIGVSDDPQGGQPLPWMLEECKSDNCIECGDPGRSEDKPTVFNAKETSTESILCHYQMNGNHDLNLENPSSEKLLANEYTAEWGNGFYGKDEPTQPNQHTAVFLDVTNNDHQVKKTGSRQQSMKDEYSYEHITRSKNGLFSIISSDTDAGFSNVNGDIFTANGVISNVNGDISTANGDLSTANGDLSTANGVISNANGDTSNVNYGIYNVNAGISDVNVITPNAGISNSNGDIFNVNCGISSVNTGTLYASYGISNVNANTLNTSGSSANGDISIEEFLSRSSRSRTEKHQDINGKENSHSSQDNIKDTIDAYLTLQCSNDNTAKEKNQHLSCSGIDGSKEDHPSNGSTDV